MFQQISLSNRLDSVAIFFHCDTLKLKVFRKWRQVIRANIKFNSSFQEEEIVEHNIELNLKYSLQQSEQFNKYHHTIQKSPKRGGYLEMYLKHKLGHNDDTNGSNVNVKYY